MTRLLLILLILSSSFFTLSAQTFTINSVVGTGNNFFYGDSGQATAADVNFPSGVAIDKLGNLFVADMQNHRIRIVHTNGVIYTYAGNGTAGFSGDGGQATAAEFNMPYDVIADSNGNIYVSDQQNQRIRKINTNGIITTVAGNGTGGYNGDGIQATAAEIFKPYQMGIDANQNLYLADCNNVRIRKINTSGVISTVAGNGVTGYSGDGGQATLSELNNPEGVTVDASGNILISDGGAYVIRKINTGGVISTVAGNGVYGFSGDGGAATSAKLGFVCGITTDASGNIYVADASNSRVRMISAGVINTIAGDGTAGFAGDGGPATAAEMNGPYGLALDKSGNIFIGDQLDNHVRELTNFTGYNQMTNSNEIRVYPNPNDGKFNVFISGETQTARTTLPGVQPLFNLEVYNVLGDKVYSQPISNLTSQLTINLGTPSPGIYMYRIIATDGSMAVTGKFVVE